MFFFILFFQLFFFVLDVARSCSEWLCVAFVALVLYEEFVSPLLYDARYFYILFSSMLSVLSGARASQMTFSISFYFDVIQMVARELKPQKARNILLYDVTILEMEHLIFVQDGHEYYSIFLLEFKFFVCVFL